MDKICIIICYYGTFPATFQSFLDTCAINLSIDWLIITDVDLKNEYRCSDNVKHLKLSLSEVEKLACKKLGIEVKINHAYKLCDYKIMYGLLFEDYLSNYDWFGYGDCDVLYGNLRKFFTPERLSKYDKIYSFGHLCLIKNNEQCKKAFMLSVPNTYEWKDVCLSSDTKGWDEHNGINLKMEAHGFNIDHSVEYIDRSTLSAHFRTVEYRDVALYFTEPWVKKLKYKRNYSSQVFALENNATYHIYIERDKTKREEVSYIHYRQKYTEEGDGCNKYIGATRWLNRNSIITDMNHFVEQYNSCDKYDSIKRIKKYYRARMDRIPTCKVLIKIGKRIKRFILK